MVKLGLDGGEGDVIHNKRVKFWLESTLLQVMLGKWSFVGNKLKVKNKVKFVLLYSSQLFRGLVVYFEK